MGSQRFGRPYGHLKLIDHYPIDLKLSNCSDDLSLFFVKQRFNNSPLYDSQLWSINLLNIR